MNGTCIKAENVTKTFGNHQVLKGINLELKTGSSLVILGGSGAGKSVLLRHLIGLHKPDMGEVWIHGNPLTKMDQKDCYRIRALFGYAFQEGALFDSLNVFENVAFPIRRHRRKMPAAQIKERVSHCLKLVGLEGIEYKLPSQLSGGMRRRVGFARAIALEPEILLFDEPTSGLDPVLTSVLNEVIIHMREALHATTVTITHDLQSARAIATEVAMLYQGKIIEQLPKKQFFASQNPIVRQFLEGKPHGPAEFT